MATGEITTQDILAGKQEITENIESVETSLTDTIPTGMKWSAHPVVG